LGHGRDGNGMAAGMGNILNRLPSGLSDMDNFS
jgi:hypothetical protein